MPPWSHRARRQPGRPAVLALGDQTKGGRQALPARSLRYADGRAAAPMVRLAGFLVHRVLAVPAAVLLHLDALAVVLLVLHRDVVAPLAGLAREGHLHSLLVPRHGPA